MGAKPGYTRTKNDITGFLQPGFLITFDLKAGKRICGIKDSNVLVYDVFHITPTVKNPDNLNNRSILIHQIIYLIVVDRENPHFH